MSGSSTPIRPLPFAASALSCAIAEKSAVNDAGVMLMTVVESDGVVVVGGDDDFDELPQALVARTMPTATAKRAVHLETRMSFPLCNRMGTPLIPISPRNMRGEILWTGASADCPV